MENPEIWTTRCPGDDFQLSNERSRSGEDLQSDPDGTLGAPLTAPSITAQLVCSAVKTGTFIRMEPPQGQRPLGKGYQESRHTRDESRDTRRATRERDFRSWEGSLSSSPPIIKKKKKSCNLILGLPLKCKIPWEGHSTLVTGNLSSPVNEL